MRSVGVAIDTGIALASSIQIKISYFIGFYINVFDIYTEVFKLRHIRNLITSSEKFDQPTIDGFHWEICHQIGIFSFEVEIVPKLKVGIAFVGLSELVENWLQSSDVSLELSIDIKMFQICQFFLQFDPIFQGASHMNVDNPAASSTPSVIKVLLAGVHDQSSGEYSFEHASATEITLQFFHNSLYSVFLDLLNDSFHKWLPIIQILISPNDQLLFASMHNKRKPQFFSVVVDVLGEPQHDHHPYLIRLDFEVSVLHVGLVEGLEKAITCEIRKFGVLHICKNLCIFLFLPQISAVAVFIRAICLSSCQILYRNGSVSLVNLLELHILVFHLSLLLLLKLLPNLVEKGHNQLILLTKQKEQIQYNLNIQIPNKFYHPYSSQILLKIHTNYM